MTNNCIAANICTNCSGCFYPADENGPTYDYYQTYEYESHCSDYDPSGDWGPPNEYFCRLSGGIDCSSNFD